MNNSPSATPASHAIQLMVQGIAVQIDGPLDDAANAPTVLMLHGWPDTHHLWDAQVAALRGQFRCARFTLPGFDVTQAPRPTSLGEMLTLVDDIARAVSPNQPVTLLLHDWGCFFGYQYAMAHPGRVARVVAVDVGDVASAAFLKSLTTLAKLQIAGYQLWLALACKLADWGLGGLGAQMTRFMARLLRCPADPTAMSAQMNYPYAAQWSGGYQRALPVALKCPVLYAFGTKKPFMFHSAKWLTALDAAPGSGWRGFKAGHWVMLDQPEAFNAWVVAWLSGEAPQA